MANAWESAPLADDDKNSQPAWASAPIAEDDPTWKSAPIEPPEEDREGVLVSAGKGLMRGLGQVREMHGQFLTKRGFEELTGPGRLSIDEDMAKRIAALDESPALNRFGGNPDKKANPQAIQTAVNKLLEEKYQRDIKSWKDKLESMTPEERQRQKEFGEYLLKEGRKDVEGGKAFAKKWGAEDYYQAKAFTDNLADEPVKTVLTTIAEQAPNLAVSLVAGLVTRGLSRPVQVGAMGATSYVLEGGDIFGEGAEFLEKKYGGFAKVPDAEWAKLVEVTNQHALFNAALDTVLPAKLLGNSELKSMARKTLMEKIFSKEGMKHITKEGIEGLATELPTEMIQETSTMLAAERMGQKYTPEEKRQRYAQVALAGGGTGMVAGGVKGAVGLAAAKDQDMADTLNKVTSAPDVDTAIDRAMESLDTATADDLDLEAQLAKLDQPEAGSLPELNAPEAEPGLDESLLNDPSRLPELIQDDSAEPNLEIREPLTGDPNQLPELVGTEETGLESDLRRAEQELKASSASKEPSLKTLSQRAKSDVAQFREEQALVDRSQQEVDQFRELTNSPAELTKLAGQVDKRLDPQRADRGERRRLQMPDEYAEQIHREKVAEHKLTPEQAEAFAPNIRKNKLNYYADDELIPTMERAQRHTEETGQESHIVYSDVFNMGGGNEFFAEQGGEPVFDEKFFIPMARMVAENLKTKSKDADVVPIRPGGDELAYVISNASKEEIEQAMQASMADITKLNKDLGLSDIKHAKKPDSPERGVGLYYGIAKIEPGKRPGDILKEASREVALDKLRRKNVRRVETETTGTATPEGQAGGAGSRAETAVGRVQEAEQATSQQTRNDGNEGLDEQAQSGSENLRRVAGRSESENRGAGSQTTGDARKGRTADQASAAEIRARNGQDGGGLRAATELIADLESGQESPKAPAQAGVSRSEKPKGPPKQFKAKTAVDRGYISNVNQINELNSLIKQAHAQGREYNGESLEELRSIVRPKETRNETEKQAAQAPAEILTDKPLADKGLTSYRYKGRFGYVMIGAKDVDDALNEANRSLTSEKSSIDKLEVWDGEKYVPAKSVKESSRAASKKGDKPLFSKTKQSKNLVATHNLSAENLEFADRMGGLAVPSIGIVNIDVDVMSGYGEITLIADRDLVDPQRDSSAKVFDADVYSPRYPTVKFKPNEKVLNKLREDVFEASKKIGDSVYSLDSSEIEDRGIGALYEFPSLQYAYLEKIGKAPKVEYHKKIKLSSELQKFKGQPSYELAESKEFQSALKREFEKEVNNGVEALTEGNEYSKKELAEIREDLWSSYVDEDGDIRYKIMDKYASAVSKSDSPPEIDSYKTRARIGRAIEKVQDDFREWVSEKYSGIIEGERIFNGFTYAGKKKWLPHDLDTVVRILKKELRDGEGFNYGAGSVRSTVAKQFKSIKQIQDARDKIVSDAEFDRIKEEISEEFVELADKFRPKYKYSGTGFGFLDSFSEVIKEGAKRGRLTAELRSDFNVDDADIQEVADFLDKLKNMPTEYFEAKLQRAVGLNEFVAAVVPKNADPKTIDLLKKNGITDIRYYTKGNNESRRKAVQSASKKTGVLFSKASVVPEGRKPLGMSTASVQKIVDEFKASLNNVDIEYSVQKTQQEAFGADAREGDRIKGGYYPKSGKIVLVAQNLNGRSDVLKVLRHETLAHFGLNTLPAETKSEVLQKIIDARESKSLKKFWDRVDQDYEGETDQVKAEEVLARIAEDPLTKLSKVWNEIVRIVQTALKKLGLIDDTVTKAELNSLIEAIAEGIRRGATQQTAGADPMFQKVFHGTPYKFDKFSLEAIGTGEGHQAYGWGLYFAGKREVAEYYRDALGDQGTDWYIDGDLVDRPTFGPRSEAMRIVAQPEMYSLKSLEDSGVPDNYLESVKEDVKRLEGRVTVKERNAANLYQAEIPEDSDLLDWDKPLKDHPQSVREALKSIGVDNFDMNGAALYREIANSKPLPGLPYSGKGSDKAASEYLNSLGIPGLRYLDNISRSKGKGSYNYVIWDENAVTVEAVNDELRQAERSSGQPAFSKAPSDEGVSGNIGTMREGYGNYERRLTDEEKQKAANHFKISKPNAATKRLKAIYRGHASDTEFRNVQHTAGEGYGAYYAGDKQYASGYGKVKGYELSVIPENRIVFDTLNDFQEWVQYVKYEVLGYKRASEFEKDFSLNNLILGELGFDGLQFGQGKDATFVDYRRALKDNADFIQPAPPSEGRGRFGGDDSEKPVFSKTRKPVITEFAQANRRLREENRDLWTKAKKYYRRQFMPGGLLPKDVFSEKIQRDNEVAVVEFDINHLVGSLENIVKSEYLKPFEKLDRATLLKFNRALTGNIDPSIKPKTQEAIVAMRQYIDSLSREYAGILQEQIGDLTSDFDAGEQALYQAFQKMQAVKPADDTPQAKARATRERNKLLDEAKELARTTWGDGKPMQAALARVGEAAERTSLLNTILGNIGTYAHRSYRAFDDKNWFKKIPDKVADDARKYLINQYIEDGETAQEAARLAEVTIHEIVKNGTAYGDMETFIRESKLGAKDLSVLKKRKQIAPEIRALMGEYIDPRVNFAKSATKMGRLVWNQRFLDRVRELGVGTFLFEGKNRPPEATVQIAAEGSEVYAPLNGLWTFPEIDQAFKDSLAKEKMADWYRFVIQMNGLVKYGKTVLSPTTAARNWQSAMFFSLANGHFNMRHMAKSIAGLREYFTSRGDAARIDYLRKLKKLGVVYDTPYAGEMMRLLEESKIDEIMQSKGAFPYQIFKKLNKFATKSYQYGDDWWKIIGFENEKSALIDAGMKETEAEREAAKRIRDTYPTYSMVGKAINWLRRFPLAGTFVSFPAEIIRTQGNILRYIHQDWNAGRKKLAMRRAAGQAFAAGMIYGLAAITKAMFGVDDDEEEAVRLLAAPWERNSNLLFIGRDESGQLQYIDLSFIDPYNYWKRPITAIFRDQPWEDSAADVFKETLSPFLGTDIAAKAIAEALPGVNKNFDTGQPIYNEFGTPFEITLEIADHLRKNLQPGIASNLERTWKAMEGERSPSGRKYDLGDEAFGWVGWRFRTLEPKTSLYYSSFEFKDAKAAASNSLSRVLRGANDVTDKDIESAYRSARRQQQNAFREMSLIVNAARQNGMSDAQIRAVLKASRISALDIHSLLKDTLPPLILSENSMTGAIKKARSVYGEDTAKELIRRYRYARQLGIRDK